MALRERSKLCRRKIDALPLPTPKKKVAADGAKPTSMLDAWGKMADQAAKQKKNDKRKKARKGKK